VLLLSVDFKGVNMKVEVIRDRVSLTITWVGEGGHEWRVRKPFSAEGVRPAEIVNPGEADLARARVLARQMDAALQDPEDIDSIVVLEGNHTENGAPARLYPCADGHINIVLAPPE
jgi:hypothetical protein